MIRHFRQSIVLIWIWLPSTHEEWIPGVIRWTSSSAKYSSPRDTASLWSKGNRSKWAWSETMSQSDSFFPYKWIRSGSLSCNTVLTIIRSDLSQLSQQGGIFNPEIEISRRQKRQPFRDTPEKHNLAAFLFSLPTFLHWTQHTANHKSNLFNCEESFGDMPKFQEQCMTRAVFHTHTQQGMYVSSLQCLAWYTINKPLQQITSSHVPNDTLVPSKTSFPSL